MVETRDKSSGGGINSALSRVWCVLLSLLLTQVYACSSRSEVEGGPEAEAMGELSFPLTYESESGRYRLAASFLIYPSSAFPENGDEPLLTLTSTAPPAPEEAPLTAQLLPGSYTVALRDWSLYKAEGDAWVAIEAEPTGTSAWVIIRADETSTVTFGFVTPPAPAQTGGTVVVEFEVTEGSLCGNGVIEPGESCDDGLLNGLPNKCSVTCSPTPEPPPPLRVSPDVPVGGSGLRWDDSMNDVQAAVDQQSAAGGGEVWIIGGVSNRLIRPNETLLDVPSNVTVRGGFIGTEETPEDRDPDFPPTWFERYDTGGPDLPLIAISDASNVLLERIAVRDAAFSATSLAISNSQAVVVRDITFVSDYATLATIDQSQVRIEDSDIALGRASLEATDSELTVVDSTLLATSYGSLLTYDSRVLLQDVVSDAPLGFSGATSRALLNRTLVTQNFERGGLIFSEGELTLVASALLDTITGDTPLTGTSVLVFDSTFAELDAGFAGGNVSDAGAISADAGEVALSTFYNAVCATDRECSYPVVLRDSGPIHNTVFVSLEPPPTNPYERDPYDWYFPRTAQQFANCATFDIDSFERSPEIPDQVLAIAHPCVDVGDAEELEASRQRLFQRVAEFLAPPFNADLSRYEDPDFWRHSTVRTDTSEDTGAPDPGRHWDVPAP
jgi:hypothetical protein